LYKPANFVTRSASNTKFFAAIYADVGASKKHLLLLSRSYSLWKRSVLSQLSELKLVVKTFLHSQRKAKIYSSFTDETVKPSPHWLASWTLLRVTTSTSDCKDERTAMM
jgi:hypothetical protein